MISEKAVNDIINDIDCVHPTTCFKLGEYGCISGDIEVQLPSMQKPLLWKIRIESIYPAKVGQHDSIHFFCNEIPEYSHIMEQGSLCYHSQYSINTEEQFRSDIQGLIKWVEIYYVGKKEDNHYEHLVVQGSPVHGKYYSFLFTDIDSEICIYDYGTVTLNSILTGSHYDKPVNNLIVESFNSVKTKKKYTCLWRNLNLPKENQTKGFFLMLKEPPARLNKFAINDFNFLNNLTTAEQRLNLSLFLKNNSSICPLFLGYKIPDGYIHWLVAMIDNKTNPLEYYKFKNPVTRMTTWINEFVSCPITWADTYNSSYELFYGRGKFSEDFCNKKILLLGAGAIGSMVARTLVKCGIRFIDIFDFDIKKPGNVCRSEYEFKYGVSSKPIELANILTSISPFVNVNPLDKEYFDILLKSSLNGGEQKNEAGLFLNKYDLIFDCTTDDGLMNALDKYNIAGDIVNLSITNKAESLVCAFSPNIYKSVRHLYDNILPNDTTDIFNPTGCWDSTFKASYNDIALMVQYAMKHIVKILTNQETKCNFYLVDSDSGLTIKRL